MRREPIPVTVVDAAERLSSRSYTDGEDSRAEWRSVYACPACGAQAAFTADDFWQHAFSQETNLSRSDADDVGIALQAHSIQQSKSVTVTSFVDFYCEGCRAVVRICYEAWGGGRYTHGYYAHFIVEKRAG